MTRIVGVYEFLKQVLFQYPQTRGQVWFRRFLILALFLIGIIHWVGFFNAGDWSLVAMDWYKESIYFDSLREALQSGVIPWQWNAPRMAGTQFVLAYPVISLTPDFVLLRWVSNSIFVIIHVLLFYSVGFLGLLLIARKIKASLVTFAFFWLLFNFNGYLVAHLAVGHLEWTGYFLLPLYFIILSKMMRESRSISSLNPTLFLGMALLLGVLFLNGSFHIAIWCSLFMIIAILWRAAIFANVVAAIILGGLLGLSRWLPTLLFFRQERAFIGGYASFSALLDAFTVVHDYETLRWWEYDIFIGFIAFVVLGICLAIAFKQNKIIYPSPFYLAAGILLLFTLGNVYALIADNPLPIPDIERVPSRFIIMPFMVFLITALGGMEELFRSRPEFSRVPLLLALPFVAYELANHSRLWRIERLNRSFVDVVEPAVSLIPASDRLYTFSIYVSWAISLVLFCVVIFFLIRKFQESRLNMSQ